MNKELEREEVFRLYNLPEGKIKYLDFRQESLNDRMINYGRDVIRIDFIMEDRRSFSQMVHKTLLIHEPGKSKKDKIKNTILSYCQGNIHLEFDETDTDKMVEEIIECFGEKKLN